ASEAASAACRGVRIISAGPSRTGAFRDGARATSGSECRDASDVDRAERTGIIGRIDPFCWLPVVPLLVLTVFSLIIGIPVLAVLFGVSALALLAFDSWVNRPRKDDAPVSSAGRK